ESRFYVDHLVTGQDAAFHGFSNALVNWLNKLFGHGAADDIVHKFVTLAGFLRLDPNLGVAVLSTAAGLADVLALGFRFPADGFAVSHLRLANIRFDLVLAHHAIDDDFEMQLAHAADNGLSAVRVSVNFEGRIFLGKTAERHAHLFLISLGLGLDRNRNYGNRKRDGFEGDGMGFITNRVARADIFQTDCGADIARQNLADIFAFVGVHLEQASNALGSSPSRAKHGVARLNLAGINTNESQLAHERISHDLESQRRKRLVIRRLPGNHCTVVRICAFHFAGIERRGQIINYSIKQRLHAFVLESGAHNYWKQFQINGRLAQRRPQFLRGDSLALQELVQDFIVVFSDSFDQLGVKGFGFFLELRRNRASRIFRTDGVILPDDRLHFDEVNHTFEFIFLANGNLDGDRLGVE